MIRRPPRSTRTDTLFPYTTLFRSLLGYARVSKAEDQDTAPQIEALEAAGCTRVYEEHASGGRWDRPELHRLLDRLEPGDVLAVWKLDRLSRSLTDLLLILDRVEKAGAGFRSLTENIRPEERRVGKECVSTVRSGWSPEP